MQKHRGDESGAILEALATLIRNTSDLAFVKDAEFTYVGASMPFANMVGLNSPDDVRGRTDIELFKDAALAERYRADDMRVLSESGALIDFEEPLPSDDGAVHFSRTSKYAILGAGGEAIGVFGIGRDISKEQTGGDISALLKQFALGSSASGADEQARRAAERLDALTGFLGYGYTFEKISRFLEIEGRLSTHSLFLIGMDALEDVNRRFGYAQGDELIRKIAQAIRRLFRASDLLGRVGPDMFLVLMKNTSGEQTIRKKAGDIVRALMFTLSDSNGAVTLGASVGVALCGVMSTDVYRLYNEAERALKIAKDDPDTRFRLVDARGHTERAPAPAQPLKADAVQLQSLLEHMDGGVLLVDVTDELRTLYVSPSFFKMTRRPPLTEGDLTSQLLEMVHPDEREGVKNAIFENAKRGENVDISYRVREVDGATGYRRLRANHLSKGENGARRLICVISDITQLKKSEDMLISTEKRFRTAIEQTGAMIWEVDIKTRTLYQSEETSQRFGNAYNVYEGMPDAFITTGVIHHESANEFRRMFANMYAGRDDEEYTIQAKTAEGDWVWLKLGYRLLSDDSGEPVRAIGTLEIRRNIEAEMRALTEEERFANLIYPSLIGTICANLSRDRITKLNMPLRDFKPETCTELFAQCPRLVCAEDIDAFRAKFLPEALLAAYKEERGFVTHEYRRLCDDGGARWTHMIVNMIRNAASGDIHGFMYLRDVEARRRWESLLPAPAKRDAETLLYTPDTMRHIAGVAVRDMDADALCALTVLEVIGFDDFARQKGLQAAQKALLTIGRLFQAGLEGSVAVGNLGEARFVVFRVDSRGAEWQRLSIERFKERMEAALSTLTADTGLRIRAGFAVEKREKADYAQMLRKADIACRTSDGWLSSSALEYNEPAMGAAGAQTLARAPQDDAQRYTVLVVDDDALSRELLTRALASDFEVCSADNGRSALEALAQRQCALVITDVQMPLMTGWELIESMRADEALKDIPVVVITADNQTDTEVKALDMGASDVIVKPFVAKTLKSRARNIIGKQESARIAEQNRLYELKFQQQANLIKRAQRDELTGLYNRQAFNRIVRERLDERPDGAYMLVYLDIDNFKIVNDSQGSLAGDRLLKDVATRLFNLAGARGEAARMEADHFVCFLPESEAQARALCDGLNDYLSTYPIDVKLTLRAGVYLIEDTNLEVGLMCDRAQLALNSIKGNFTTRTALYDKSLRDKLLEERQLSAEMPDALENGQFLIYFQPQYDYSTGEIVGAEALARWKHPKRGMIPPGKFIPLFERDGQISALDAYVWEKSCQYLRRWQDMMPGRSISISVNLSRIDLYNTRLCDNLRALIDKYRLNPAQLKLEITESVYIDDPNYLISVVARLQSMGFTIEMDDFGSGYSSLNTLKDVPVDVLKLDTKFLAKSLDEVRGGNILSSVIRMARWLNLTVIAEGVETKEQADYLKNLNCMLMQGFYFARPMPAEEYETLLLSGATCDIFGKAGARLEGMAAFWDPSAQTTLLFNSFVGGAAIVEYNADNVEVLRTNDNYYKELGVTREEYEPYLTKVQNGFDAENRQRFLRMLEQAVETGEESECELFRRALGGAGDVWTHERARLLAQSEYGSLMYISIENITSRKQMESKLATRRYGDALVNLCDELIEIDYGAGTATIRASKFPNDARLLTPMPLERAIERWCDKRVHADDADKLKAIFSVKEPDASVSGSVVEYRFYDMSGAPRRMRATFLDAGGSIWLVCNTYLGESERADDAPRLIMGAGDMSGATEHEQIMRAVAEHSERVVMRFNPHTREAVFVRGGAEAIGLPARTEALPEAWLNDGTVIENSAEDWMRLFDDMRESTSGGAKIHMRLTNGRERWCDVRFSNITNIGGGVRYTVISFLDITEEHERALAYERYLQTIYTARDDCATYVDVDITTGRLLASGGDGLSAVRLNCEHQDMSVFVKLLSELLDDGARDEARAFLDRNAMLKQYRAGRRDLYAEWRVMGEPARWLSVGVQMTRDLESGNVKAFLLLREIAEEKERRLAVNPRAEWDGMTGLYNRATCERLIRDTLMQKTGVPCALLIMDIDDLKALNDGLGHQNGDLAIQLIAAQLKRHFRKTDIIGRFGGDEFAAFLIGADSEEKLRGTILALINRVKLISVGDNGAVPLRVSVGAVFGKTGEDSFETLYEKADIALYSVKHTGKGVCAFYSSDMDAQSKPGANSERRALKDARALGFEGMRKLIEQLSSFYPYTYSVNLTRNRCARVTGEGSERDMDYDHWVLKQLAYIRPDERARARDMFMSKRVLIGYAQGNKRIETSVHYAERDNVYKKLNINAAFASDGAGGDVCGVIALRPENN